VFCVPASTWQWAVQPSEAHLGPSNHARIPIWGLACRISGLAKPQVTGGDHGLALEIVITPKCALTRESPYYYYLLITV
jgi:hypothetical protein